MSFTKELLLAIIILTFGSCTLSEDVVQHGRFQKRKYAKEIVGEPEKQQQDISSDMLVASAVEEDPYLIPLDLAMTGDEAGDENMLPSIRLTREINMHPSPKASPSNIDPASGQVSVGRASEDILKTSAAKASASHFRGLDGLLLLMTTGLALLLPALILGVLLVRGLKISGSDPVSVYLAVISGLASLVALAML